MNLSDPLHAAWTSAGQALDLAFAQLTAVAPGWVAAGVMLHLLHQVVRTRGWFNILRAACPSAAELRARDVTLAYLAGAGLNGVVPARGGDVAKLYLVRRRAPRMRWSTLAATFVPETLFESAVAAALLVWVISAGLVPAPSVPDGHVLLAPWTIQASALPVVAIAAGAGALVLSWRTVRDRASGLIRCLLVGLAILERPLDFVRGVIVWQALARIIRAGSLAALMTAFGLPVTLGTVLLVMAVQGGSRLLPSAPASAGMRIALLAYGLPALTGETVAVARITAFSVGAAATLGAVGLVIALAILGRELGTASPRTIVRRLRRRLGTAHAARPARVRPVAGHGHAAHGPRYRTWKPGLALRPLDARDRGPPSVADASGRGRAAGHDQGRRTARRTGTNAISAATWVAVMNASAVPTDRA
ncbi:MAG TPA: lysylphosphatidylglycerol synthase transmembrane domain-containing protein [Solirubrobacteraceae bacterium]|nr:lysylphosphatidylglycerol synthase transmembrane domain-containing protein [Solirubrobacteraceae bacterium]